MNSIKTLLIVLAIALSNVLVASNDPSTKTPSPISKEISQLLVKPGFTIENELSAKITFVTNSDNEIIVLKVDTDNETLDNFIKSRLNYHVMSTKLTSKVTYQVPLKFIIK